MLQVNIPLAGVWIAFAIGGGIGAFIFLALVWRFYVDTDSARHSYMAREIAGLRQRHNDYTDVQHLDPFPERRKLRRAVHYLLDKLYSRGRPQNPE